MSACKTLTFRCAVPVTGRVGRGGGRVGEPPSLRVGRAASCSAPAAAGIRRSSRLIAVGTPVARRPPHRPGRAVLPHPVLTVDGDVEAALRPGMLDSRCREPFLSQPSHPVLRGLVVLAAPPKRLLPETKHACPEGFECVDVVRHCVVRVVAAYYALQPPALFRYGVVLSSPEFGCYLVKFPPHPPCVCPPMQRKAPLPCRPADRVEP